MTTSTILPQARANLRAAKRATHQQQEDTYRALLAHLSEALDVQDGRIVAVLASSWSGTKVSYIVSVVRFTDGVMITPKRVRSLTASMDINQTIGRLVRQFPAWHCVPSAIGAGYQAAHDDWATYLSREAL